MNLTRTIPLVAGLLMTAGTTLAEPEVRSTCPSSNRASTSTRHPRWKT